MNTYLKKKHHGRVRWIENIKMGIFISDELDLQR
jgi:hypothetical protein